ncbi:hypothetical protein [Mycobacterium branderi]|uniref:hypothetical protein n=1 Tax=Mycobacterium branderi TaxID=43348 RepID=UPI00111C701E|nr:hypothetical protein [Mycobacterium branderi]MCV7231715.1 hypothetical protein [Mycobacterium branderi]
MWFVDLSQRKFSLFVVFSYFFYVGIPALVTIRVLERHPNARRGWASYLLLAVPFYTIFEIPPVTLDWLRYYGDPPLQSPITLPATWSFGNSAAVVASGAMVYGLMHGTTVLKGRRSALLVVLMPMLVGGIHLAVFVPYFTAINSTDNRAVQNAGAVLTIALSLFAIWLVYEIVSGIRPRESHEPTLVSTVEG